jgi:hypothetical protein
MRLHFRLRTLMIAVAGMALYLALARIEPEVALWLAILVPPVILWAGLTFRYPISLGLNVIYFLMAAVCYIVIFSILTSMIPVP